MIGVTEFDNLFQLLLCVDRLRTGVVVVAVAIVALASTIVVVSVIVVALGHGGDGVRLEVQRVRGGFLGDLAAFARGTALFGLGPGERLLGNLHVARCGHSFHAGSATVGTGESSVVPKELLA